MNEIVKNPSTVAMAQLDYVHPQNFKYEFDYDVTMRYGFRWDMQFFLDYFRPNQLRGKNNTDPLP